MKTKNIDDLPTPCYIVDEALLEKNLITLQGVRERTGAKILLAQKAFSMYALYPLIGEYLDGATASGLYEARLGAEEMAVPLKARGISCENHIFSPAYREEEFEEILRRCDHIVFNSWAQVRKFGERAKRAGKSIGLRINPECSTQAGHAIYDPCAPGSRLGVTAGSFGGEPELLSMLDGLHFHTLCEQNSDDLEKTLDAVEEKFGCYLEGMKWINFGGGHHITRVNYDIPRLERCIGRMQEKYGLTVYLEPGEAVALNAGFLVTKVLETWRTEIPVEARDDGTEGGAGLPGGKEAEAGGAGFPGGKETETGDVGLPGAKEAETGGAGFPGGNEAETGGAGLPGGKEAVQVTGKAGEPLRLAILDASAACHMPDVLEMPYRPPLLKSGLPGEKKFTYRLGGPTCLAGDIIGDYSFDRPLAEGDRLVFEDMAIYSMVKNNTFNGMPLPAIVLREKSGEYRMVKRFGYEDFRNRLS
ncbi:MAG: carboxynorspermidine decarboxylase [Roseburia sp.]|nr:carboxynorspermidine decarboxylase [Roseburia sp.]